MNISKHHWTILPYRDDLKQDFIRLNSDWITEYFELEPGDHKLFEDPSAIIRKGGAIFFLKDRDSIAGTASLFTTQDTHTFEVARMAVDPRYRNRGVGKALLQYLINFAAAQKVEKLELYTDICLEPALRLYRAAGFREVTLDSFLYKRSNIKMELPLSTNGRTPWFKRNFPKNLPAAYYQQLQGRLQKFPDHLAKRMSGNSCLSRPGAANGTWTPQQHVGHLFLLESLWLRRFREIAEGKAIMSEADLSNTATHTNSFSEESISCWLDAFSSQRNNTLNYLNSLSAEMHTSKSIHPRLNQSMSLIDFMYFVSEHDEHHYHAITEIISHPTLDTAQG